MDNQAYKTIVTGEFAGTVTAVQFSNIPCSKVKFKAIRSNAGNVYIGGSGVTRPTTANNTTTGFELDAGEETPWLEVDNLNKFYRICDNAGDEICFIALR